MTTRDDERARASFERNANRRVEEQGESAGPIGRKIVSENTQLLADFIERVRGDERPTERTYTQKSLLPNVWDRISPVSSAVLAEACLAGVLNYGRAPLKDDEEHTPARSLSLIGTEIEKRMRRSTFHVEGGEQFRAQAVERLKTWWKEDWSSRDRLETGAWAYDSCLQALPHVFERGKYGPQAKEDVKSAAVYIPPMYVPSLRKPKPWTTFNNPEGEPFLRHTRLSVADLEAALLNGQMQPQMEAVSYLQSALSDQRASSQLRPAEPAGPQMESRPARVRVRHG